MGPDERPPRLQPPPRVGLPTNGADDGDMHRGRQPSGMGGAGLAVLFASLTIALVGVFVVLPRWTASRPQSADRETPVTREPTMSRTATASPFAAGKAEGQSVPPPKATPRPVPARPPRPLDSAPPDPPPPTPPNEASFVSAMSRGLQALDRGDWDVAREAFRKASELRPGAPEVADGLARTAAAERRALVDAGIRRGLELEAIEDWAKAEEVYRRVLEVEPEAAGALEGRDRAAERAALDERLQYHVRNPGRLASPGVFDEATELLAEARELIPKGPRLEDQLARLEKSLEVASTPVPVVVVSDDATEVVIYRVDRLGVFSRRELSLRPGTYTAVGSRTGFRDVRVQFTVTAGAPPKAVTVVCTEKL